MNSPLPLSDDQKIDEICDDFERLAFHPSGLQFAQHLDRNPGIPRAALLKELCAVALDILRKRRVSEPIQEILLQNSGLAAELGPILASTDICAPTIERQRRNQRTSRELDIRCPHCHHAIELAVDSVGDLVRCQACGGEFNIAAPTSHSSKLPPLRTVGRFNLISRLGVGGFGTVWLGRDPKLEKDFAIKIPRYGESSESELRLFFREANATAQLSHPNIVPVHEVGQEHDMVYIVSDFVDGAPLSELIKSRPPNEDESVRIMILIADALHHAHEKGVIHRDLKPANIMIGNDGQPHIMDFGLAKRDMAEVTIDLDGNVVGTPAYMSPEQAAGDNEELDRRSDILLTRCHSVRASDRGKAISG